MTNNHYAKVLGLKMACKKIVMKKKKYHKKKMFTSKEAYLVEKAKMNT